MLLRFFAPAAPLLFVIAVGVSATCRPGPAPFSPLTPDLVVENNRGVGLMGRFDYADAAKAFGAVASARPDALDAQVNLKTWRDRKACCANACWQSTPDTGVAVTSWRCCS